MRRRVSGAVMAVVLIGVALFVGAIPAAACVCDGGSLDVLRGYYEAGFIGSISGNVSESGHLIFEVERGLYGPIEGPTVQVREMAGCGGKIRRNWRTAIFITRVEGEWVGGDRCGSLPAGVALAEFEPQPSGAGDPALVTIAPPELGALAYLDRQGRLLDVVGPPTRTSGYPGRLWRCGDGPLAVTTAATPDPERFETEITLWNLASRTVLQTAVVQRRGFASDIGDLRCETEDGATRVLLGNGGAVEIVSLFSGPERRAVVVAPYWGWMRLTAGGLVVGGPTGQGATTIVAIAENGTTTTLRSFEGLAVPDVRLAVEPGTGGRVAAVHGVDTLPGGDYNPVDKIATVTIFDGATGGVVVERQLPGGARDVAWIEDRYVLVLIEDVGYLLDSASLAEVGQIDARYVSSANLIDGHLWLVAGGSVNALPIDGSAPRSGHQFGADINTTVLAVQPVAMPPQATSVPSTAPVPASIKERSAASSPSADGRAAIAVVVGAAAVAVAVGLIALRRRRLR